MEILWFTLLWLCPVLFLASCLLFHFGELSPLYSLLFSMAMALIAISLSQIYAALPARLFIELSILFAAHSLVNHIRRAKRKSLRFNDQKS